MLRDWVRSIRSDKSGRLSAELSLEHRKLLGERIMPSGWYPFDFYKACFLSVSTHVVHNDPRMLHCWGFEFGQKIIQEAYSSVSTATDPQTALSKYKWLVNGRFFDFGEIDVVKMSDNSARLTVKNFDDDFDAFYYLVAGWIEGSVKLTGAQHATCKVESLASPGSPTTVYLVAW
jgi:hypothetical protein